FRPDFWKTLCLKSPRIIRRRLWKISSKARFQRRRRLSSNNSSSKSLTQQSHLKLQNRALDLKIVARGQILNFRAGFVELGLAELDDRAESQVVARLGQIHCQVRRRQQLVGESDALEGVAAVQPGDVYVMRHAVFGIAHAFGCSLRA